MVIKCTLQWQVDYIVDYNHIIATINNDTKKIVPCKWGHVIDGYWQQMS